MHSQLPAVVDESQLLGLGAKYAMKISYYDENNSLFRWYSHQKGCAIKTLLESIFECQFKVDDYDCFGVQTFCSSSISEAKEIRTELCGI